MISTLHKGKFFKLFLQRGVKESPSPTSRSGVFLGDAKIIISCGKCICPLDLMYFACTYICHVDWGQLGDFD